MSADSKPRRVTLVCLPFQSLRVAPLALPLLGSWLRHHGLPCEERYFHFDFARIFGEEGYRRIAEAGSGLGLVGETLFAEQENALGQEISASLREIFGPDRERHLELERFGSHCLEEIMKTSPEVVGFSTSFNQLRPSLWLAEKIKALDPHLMIVLGGSACLSPMGETIKDSFSFVDAVVSGDGELPLLSVARGDRIPPDGILQGKALGDLDDLPTPDFDAYLRDAGEFAGDRKRSMLAFETSRGCWWGQKTQCRFCGISKPALPYRSKTPAKVAREIRGLWKKYKRNLYATDVILDPNQLESAFRGIESWPSKPSLFFEVKVNMGRSDLERLRRAGVQWIQPGVESLSSSHLRLLRKGTSSLQNLAFLKWCRELGIRVTWNLLYRIPGEKVKDYQAQIELIDRIPHFPPPTHLGEVRLERFSSYFESYSEYGWTDVTPELEYASLYPQLSEAALRRLAYHFVGQGLEFAVDRYLPKLADAVDRWRLRHGRGDGVYWDEKSGLLRLLNGEETWVDATPPLYAVIDRTKTPVRIGELEEQLPGSRHLIDELLDLGALLREGEKLLCLAVPAELDRSSAAKGPQPGPKSAGRHAD